jgi:hypothetical protein
MDPKLKNEIEGFGDRSPCAEGRVTVGHEQHRVRLHSKAPSANTHYEVEQSSRVAPGEQDREPGDYDGEDRDHQQ